MIEFDANQSYTLVFTKVGDSFNRKANQREEQLLVEVSPTSFVISYLHGLIAFIVSESLI